jgi:hypothetical protein
MQRLPANLISKFDATTIRFQTAIMNRLKLFDFSKSAILHYAESQKKEFQGYSFENLQDRFRLIGFKRGSTVKSIDYKDMVNVGNSFIRAELSDSVFVLNMATFEHWLLWILKALILSNPQEFYPKSKKQIEITYLRKFPEMSTLWEELVDDYLSSVPYQGMKALLKTFLNCFGFKETDVTKNLLDMINENSQCRNIIMHNQRKVNASYTKKCGRFAKYAEGDSVVLTEEILFQQSDNLLRFMQDVRNNWARGR